MKRKYLWILFICVLACTAWAREKTEIFGKCTWYTEQNAFVDLLKIAQAENKPILAVFSATWCGPCQQIKNEVFKHDDFQRVGDKALLLYIEQTTPEGQNYCKQYQVKGFPTFMIFSKDGIQLEENDPDRTVDGFLSWVNEVASGNNFYELSRKIEANPNDRNAMLNITFKIDSKRPAIICDYLKRIIKLNPDVKDELTQKAYEKLPSYLVMNVIYNPSDTGWDAYIKEHNTYIENLMAAYYPGKFKYELQGGGIRHIIGWYRIAENYEKAISIFTEYIKQKGTGFDPIADIDVVYYAYATYLDMEKDEDAFYWLLRLRRVSVDTQNLLNNQKFIAYYFRMYNELVKILVEEKKTEEAEKYARIFYDELKRFKRVEEYFDVISAFSADHGLLKEKILADIQEKISTYTGPQMAWFTISQAKILVQLNQKEEAQAMLVRLYEDQEYFKTIKGEAVADILNGIAATMVAEKIVNTKTLEMAKKAVSLCITPEKLHTLATVHAELGNYAEAIHLERKALKKSHNQTEQETFTRNIQEWEKQRKELR